jgi:peroxiredoxin (alkyl hydroperoxide reductase subunit C)
MTHLRLRYLVLVSAWIYFAGMGTLNAASTAFEDRIYDPGPLKPRDSVIKVKVGEVAPDFELKGIDGESVRLSTYRGQKNVLLSFVPAAWTPVCSDQWPGYNLLEALFDGHDTILLGITTDNLPSLFAWTRQMGGLWFPVLSDFWPHGAVAGSYGVLRSDGTAERALIFIDKQGRIRHIHVGDINVRPKLDLIVEQLGRLKP